MHGTGESMETLGVDSKSLAKFGNDLVTSADDIPPPPAPFTVTGTDPISTKIMGMQSRLETPIQTGLPEVKAAAKKTGSTVVTVADLYERTDEQLAQRIEQLTFDEPTNCAVGGGSGGTQGVVGLNGNNSRGTGTFSEHIGGKLGSDTPGTTAPSAGEGMPAAGSPGGALPDAGSAGAGPPASGTPGAATPVGAPSAGAPGAGAASAAAGTSSGASSMGQIGQFISMPMQMAGQAIGALAAIPQSVMQGVESAVQQVGQATGGIEQDGESASDKTELTADHEGDESPTRPAAPETEQEQGATPGQPNGERAPDSQRHGPTGASPAAPSAPAPAEKPPAQTRPAEVAERMNI